MGKVLFPFCVFIHSQRHVDTRRSTCTLQTQFIRNQLSHRVTVDKRSHIKFEKKNPLVGEIARRSTKICSASCCSGTPASYSSSNPSKAHLKVTVRVSFANNDGVFTQNFETGPLIINLEKTNSSDRSQWSNIDSEKTSPQSCCTTTTRFISHLTWQVNTTAACRSHQSLEPTIPPRGHGNLSDIKISLLRRLEAA